jgi:hypothetical protein
MFGLYMWGTGWLFWLGATGAFAIGASLGPDDRRWLVGGLLVGALANAFVAVFQVVRDPLSGALVLYGGKQANGLLGNPIHLEALLLGALALVLGRTCRSPRRWCAVVVLLAVALEFTYERFAIVILVLLVVYALYSYGVRRGGAFALLIGLGYGIAYLSAGSGLGSRVVSGSGETTFGVRARIWWAGARYMLHHPLFGVGPGQLRTAMDSTATLSFFQHVLAGKILTDGHDVFVEVGVTTGVLGLVCFLAWLFGSARVARNGAFLGLAAAMIAVELVEPINVAILPLAFLGIGAATAATLREGEIRDTAGRRLESMALEPAGTSSAQDRRAGLFGRLVTIVTVVMALFLGVTMVIGDAYMQTGLNYRLNQPYNLAAAKEANSFLPYWPDSALEIAQIEAYESVIGKSASPATLALSRHWVAVAATRDSRDPRLWTFLGSADLELKDYGLASTDYHRALSCDKWYPEALEGLGQLAGIQHNWKEAANWYRLALATVIKYPSASSQLRGLLHEAERNASTGRG